MLSWLPLGHLLYVKINVLADLKLNCINVREFRNHFGKKNIYVTNSFFLQKCTLGRFAILSLWKSNLCLFLYPCQVPTATLLSMEGSFLTNISVYEKQEVLKTFRN